VTYRDEQRIEDVLVAIEAIRAHLLRGALSDGLVFDAVRIRLLEIGEAVKSISSGLLETEPSIPWQEISRMRDLLAHRYFDTSHAIIQATVDNDLPELEQAALRLRGGDAASRVAVGSQEIRTDRRRRGAERDAAVYSAEQGGEDPDGLDAFTDYTSRSELDDLD
jgi:uncharacterized protein with HEPN domain